MSKYYYEPIPRLDYTKCTFFTIKTPVYSIGGFQNVSYNPFGGPAATYDDSGRRWIYYPHDAVDLQAMPNYYRGANLKMACPQFG